MRLTRTLKSEREEIVSKVSDIAENIAYEQVKHLETELYLFNDIAKSEAIKIEKLKLFPQLFKEQLIEEITSNDTSFQMKDNIDFVAEVKFFGWIKDITDTFDKYCSVK